MKVIQIKASQFFELLKLRDTSMWEIFAQMVDGEEKELVFTDEEDKVLFNYTLPTSTEQLEADREVFSAQFSEKIKQQLN